MNNAQRFEHADIVPERVTIAFSDGSNRDEEIKVALSKTLPRIRNGVAEHMAWLQEKIAANRKLRTMESYQRASAFDAALQELLGSIIDGSN